MTNSLIFIAGICSFVPYLIFIPWSIYGTTRLYQCRNELFVQKRNISIAIGLNCAFIFQMIASCLSHLSILYLNTIAITISFSIFFLAYWILIFFLNTKNWIIYYHEKWTYYVKDMEWQQIINPKVKESGSKRNWFITNRHKYGNRLYIFKLFGVLHLLGLVLLIVGQYILMTSDGHPNGITFSICMIIISITPYILFYIFIVFRTPRFNDIFNIHWESQMHVRLIVVIAIGLIAFMIWFAIDFANDISKLWAMLCFPFFTLMLFFMTMVSSLFVIKKTHKRNALSINNMYHMQTSNTRTQSRSNSRSNKADKRQYTLHLILETKETFHLFMVHLSKEFSLECLLAYIEMTQFQQYIIKNNVNSNKIVNETIEQLKLLIFPSSIPISSIVDDNIQLFKFKNLKNTDTQYKLKLAKLFEKYIKVGAEYEINISYAQRNAWMSMMSTPSNLWSFMHVKVDLNEILLLIEQCKSTLSKLLEHSLNRFKTYPKFFEVEQILDRQRLLVGRNSNASRRRKGSEASETGGSKIVELLNRLPSLKPRMSLSKSKSLEVKQCATDNDRLDAIDAKMEAFQSVRSVSEEPQTNGVDSNHKKQEIALDANVIVMDS